MKLFKEIKTIEAYMIFFIGAIYLYMFIKGYVMSNLYCTGWEWILFFLGAIVALFVYSLGSFISYVLIQQVLQYYEMPENFIVVTILAFFIAPLIILAGSFFIPPLFDLLGLYSLINI